MSSQSEHYKRKRTKAIAHLGGTCVVCGTTENLEFDHIEAFQKEFNISSVLRQHESVYIVELNKCQLLCHEHHLEKHQSDAHGLTQYRKGCRCAVCKAAQSVSNKEQKIKRKLRMLNSAERVPSLQVGSPRFNS